MAALIQVHAEWILGLGHFSALRASRIARGIPEATAIADLVKHAVPTWSAQMRLVERGLVRWRSQIQIRPSDGGVVVEHVVTCDDATEQGFDAPEVVCWILDECESVVPEGLAPCGVLEVAADDVEELVDRLLDPEREAPIVAVAVDNGRREPLVDVFELARRLAGTAEVVSLMTIDASMRLRDELVARGLSERFGCYHGAARLYWPGLAVGDSPYDHPLFLRHRILAAASERRTESCADMIGEVLVDGEVGALAGSEERAAAKMPVTVAPAWPVAGRIGEILHSWLAESLPHDRARAPMPVPSRTVQREERRADGVLGADGAARSELSGEVARLRQEVTNLRADLATSQRELAAATAKLAARRPDEEVLAELAAEVEAQQADAARKISEERRLRRRAEQERDEAAALLGSPRSIADAVAVAAAIFPEQLVILKSAHTSAAASAYREPGRVLAVLCVLGLVGNGDVGQVVNLIFGNAARWKPKDSPETARTFGVQRTWAGEDGKAKLFSRHVTLGHGLDGRGCLQVYYDVLPDGRIEVAWVGEHRPTVSIDT